ncbi:MAG: alpha/beta hydrolase [Bacteroidia bacterium]
MENLLLLHGAIGSKKQLATLEQHLKNHFKVHTLNFNGHGELPFTEIYSIEQFSNDVLNYLNENNIAQISIFGYSMGGYVALYFAKHFPERVNKIITLATKFLWTTAIAEKEIKLLNVSKITEKLPAFAESLRKLHQPNDWEVVLQKTASMMLLLGANNCLHLTDYKKIITPNLIMIGDKDSMVSLEESMEVYRHLKNANLAVLSNTIHPIEKVNTERLALEIKLFLNIPIAQESIIT